MFLETKSLIDFLIAAAVFGLVFGLWVFAVMLGLLRRSKQAKRIEKRLGLGAQESGEERVLALWIEDRAVTTKVPGIVRTSVLDRLDQLTNDAGWDVSAGSVLLGLGSASFFSVVAVAIIGGNVLPGLCVAAALTMVFWFYLKHCINKRRSTFESQLVDALDLAARSLRAGHPLNGAFHLISEEVLPPVGSLFAEICQQQSLGQTLEQALQGVAQRSTSDDLKLFATSVIIQMKSGGNLADMMQRLAEVIRDRIKLGRRVRVLTAQTQFSKRVLLALPFCMFLLLNILNPTYLNPLYTTSTGQIMLATGGFLLILGAWTMNKMVQLRY